VFVRNAQSCTLAISSITVATCERDFPGHNNVQKCKNLFSPCERASMSEHNERKLRGVAQYRSRSGPAASFKLAMAINLRPCLLRLVRPFVALFSECRSIGIGYTRGVGSETGFSPCLPVMRSSTNGGVADCRPDNRDAVLLRRNSD
jgi:hypothetical protein